MGGGDRVADGPAPGGEAIVESWDANAAAWIRAVREGLIESRRTVTDAAILAAVRARSPGRVLDLGCGEGWLARALAGDGREVVGLDAVPALVEAARAAHPPGAVPAAYHAVDYAAFVGAPLRFGRFDAVVANFALLDEPAASLLAACRAALAGGGAVVVQTVHPWTAAGDGPYADGWRTERFCAFGAAFAAPMPWYARTMGSWLAAIRDAGLVVDALEEPVDPRGGRPLSLLLVATAA